MAKSGFWLRGAKGKLAGTTLYRGKGGTIQREIVTPTNPRTLRQMIQRVRFASAGLFYKRAKQALFKFAYQNKKANWSDYNAFMNVNQIDIYPTYEEAHNPLFPLVGQWQLSKGELNTPRCFLSNVPEDFQTTALRNHAILCAPFYFEAPSEGEEDTFTWDQFLAENPHVQVGDIVTFVAIVSDAHYDAQSGVCVAGTYVPKWIIRQFIVRSGSGIVSAALAQQGLVFAVGDGTYPDVDSLGGVCLDLTADSGHDDIVIDDSDKYVVGGTVIISRNTKNGLLVSDSTLLLGCAGGNFAEYLYENEGNAAASWGAAADAILQGSLVQ